MSVPAAAPRRPRVLLLAGDVRETWAAALALEFEVATTGWLDGVTAARLDPPDAVLVSTGLPEGAPGTICTAFHSAGDLRRIPVVVAGEGAERLDREALASARADRYVPAPVEGDALLREVREAVNARRPEMPLSIGFAVVALMCVGLGALIAPPGFRGARSPWSIVVFGGALLAAFAVVFWASPRPLAPSERRRVVSWAGTWCWMLGTLAPDDVSLARIVPLSLACAAWAVWAWLGPRVARRGRAATRWFHVLAGVLAVAAAAPWIAMLWIRAGW